MKTGIDTLENEIAEQFPDVLRILLRDHTTQKNIFWATDNYKHFGKSYGFNEPILPELITGENGNIIMPRVHKDKFLQQSYLVIGADFKTDSDSAKNLCKYFSTKFLRFMHYLLSPVKTQHQKYTNLFPSKTSLPTQTLTGASLFLKSTNNFTKSIT